MKNVVFFVLQMLTIALFGCAVYAQSSALVEDIDVDMTASSATEAREKAVIQGEVEALSRLITRIVPGGAEAAAKPDAATAQNLVQSIDINDEIITGKRYRARLTIRFDSEGVQEWLEQHNMKAVVRQASRLLVLPILEDRGHAVLWGDNAWFDAWKKNTGSASNGTWKLPSGDLKDVQEMPIEKLLARETSASSSAFNAWMARQDVDAIVIAWFRRPDPATAQPSSVMLQVLDKKMRVLATQVVGNESMESAAKQLADALPQQWLFYVQHEEGFGLEHMRVRAPLRSLEDWRALQNSLSALPGINSIQLRQLNAKWVEMEWKFQGSEQIIITAAAAQGIALERDRDGWVVRR